MAKCSYCKSKNPIVINTPIYSFCSYECASSLAKDKQIKTSNKKIKEAADKVKSFNKETRRLKATIKPKSKWLSELQAVFNQYIRLRDVNDGCISCDKGADWQGQFHAGHYYSRGHSSSLRFNLWNCHKQCSVCNNHLSGNIGNYTPKLIDKIGQDRFNELLVHKSDARSYDVEWIKRAIKACKLKIKRGMK
tara:strand:+ start:1522 stop:2097 length:576 start_codon:yes stop_codon:yes gene_type:complete